MVLLQMGHRRTSEFCVVSGTGVAAGMAAGFGAGLGAGLGVFCAVVAAFVATSPFGSVSCFWTMVSGVGRGGERGTSSDNGFSKRT